MLPCGWLFVTNQVTSTLQEPESSPSAFWSTKAIESCPTSISLEICSYRLRSYNTSICTVSGKVIRYCRVAFCSPKTKAILGRSSEFVQISATAISTQSKIGTICSKHKLDSYPLHIPMATTKMSDLASKTQLASSDAISESKTSVYSWYTTLSSPSMLILSLYSENWATAMLITSNRKN